MPEMRLQKYISNAGICSRRKAEELITSGKVSVNETVVTELGTKVDSDTDIVKVNGKKIKCEQEHVYILLNKPVGYVTTVDDQFDRPIVLDLVKGVKEKLIPVGRLDMYTSGALILTNDGDFIYRVTHPKNEVKKTYNVTLIGEVTDEEVNQLRTGVKIDDYVSGKALVRILKIDKEKNISRLEITIHEGKNREVRKMCNAIGKKVIALHRAKVGNLDVKSLKIGEWRYLTEDEIKSF